MGTRTQISKPPKLASVDVKERRARDYYFTVTNHCDFPPLGFMAVKVFLGGQNQAAKEYNVSLTVAENRQENVIPWLFL